MRFRRPGLASDGASTRASAVPSIWRPSRSLVRWAAHGGGVLRSRLGGVAWIGKRPRTGLVQVLVQRGVVPGPAVPVGQLLELPEEALRELGGVLLERGITEVDAAAQRPRVPRRAAALVVLPGAGLAVVEARGPARGRRRSGAAASGADRKSVWPYSWNRQHRPLSSQTGPWPATASSSSPVESLQLDRESSASGPTSSDVFRLRRDRSWSDSSRWTRGSAPPCRAGPVPTRGRSRVTCFQSSGRLDILGPERPGPALDRTRGIHRAPGLGVPEDAVSAGPLDQAEAVSDLPDELLRELLDRLAPESASSWISSVVTQT